MVSRDIKLSLQTRQVNLLDSRAEGVMAEQVYLNRNQVRITSTRAVFGSKTYALGSVSSVERRELDRDRTMPYVTILGGVLVCCVALFLFSFLESALVGAVLLLLGLVLIVLGGLWASRIEPAYAVILCTTAGERRALASADEDEIGEIVEALNQAIIDRG